MVTLGSQMSYACHVWHYEARGFRARLTCEVSDERRAEEVSGRNRDVKV